MYIAKIDTIINYMNFNAGDVVPDLYVSERLVENGVLKFVPNPEPVKTVKEVKEIKETPKSFKKSKKIKEDPKQEILTEDTSNVEITEE